QGVATGSGRDRRRAAGGSAVGGAALMRVLEPVRQGRVGRFGARTHYEVFGAGRPTVLLLMPNVITQRRAWKAQDSFLSSSYQVVTVDRPHNGASYRP